MVRTDLCDYGFLYDTLGKPDRLKKRFYMLMRKYWGQYSAFSSKIPKQLFDNWFESTVFIDKLAFVGPKPLDTPYNKGTGHIIHTTNRIAWNKKAKGRLTKKKHELELSKKSVQAKFKNGVLTALWNDRLGLDEGPDKPRKILEIYKPVHPNTVIPALHKIKQRQPVPNACILLAMYNYDTSGMHTGHAMGAFKHYDTLYCFNAWGELSKPSDHLIWDKIKRMYKCTKKIVYTGWSFQLSERNNKGACVGYTSNFCSLMYVYILIYNLHKTQGITLPPIPTTQQEFNQFVMQLFNNFKGVFGLKYNMTQPLKSSRIIFHNLKHEKRILQKRNKPGPNVPVNMDINRPRKRKQSSVNKFVIRKKQTRKKVKKPQPPIRNVEMTNA